MLLTLKNHTKQMVVNKWYTWGRKIKFSVKYVKFGVIM